MDPVTVIIAIIRISKCSTQGNRIKPLIVVGNINLRKYFGNFTRYSVNYIEVMELLNITNEPSHSNIAIIIETN